MAIEPVHTIAFTGEKTFLAKQFWPIWETLCDEFRLDQPFTLDDAADLLAVKYGWAKSTAKQYAKAVLHHAARNTDPDDPGIERISVKFWKFPPSRQ